MPKQYKPIEQAPGSSYHTMPCAGRRSGAPRQARGLPGGRLEVSVQSFDIVVGGEDGDVVKREQIRANAADDEQAALVTGSGANLNSVGQDVE